MHAAKKRDLAGLSGDLAACRRVITSASSNEYLLTANDGSTWEVRSDNVSLADHVGHQVSATGVVTNATAHNLKEDAKDAAADAHMKKGNSEHGHMKITDVQMVNDACQK